MTLRLFLSVLLAQAAQAASNPTQRNIASIECAGAPALDCAALRDASGLKVGAAWSAERKDGARDRVLDALQGMGYLEAAAEIQSTAKGSAVALTLRLTPGPAYVFGPAVFEGLRSITEGKARELLPFQPGDPYNRRELYRAQSALYRSGWFEDVTVTASTDSARTAAIRVDVREKRMQSLRGGVGWGSEESERLSLIWSHRNFLRRLYTAEAAALYSRIWREYRVGFSNPRLWSTRNEVKTDFRWRREDRQGYDIETTAGAFGVARPLPRAVRAGLRHRVERSVVYNAAPGVGIGGDHTTSALGLSVSRAKAEPPQMPETGTRLNLLIERAGGGLGGDFDFHKFALNAAAYRKVLPRLVLAGGLRAGRVEPFGDSPEVPIFERFFTGGGGSVRGYRERGIGPRSDDGPLGARAMLSATAEARVKLIERVHLALFIDGGQAAARSALVMPANWRFGTGAGVRVKTPIGPIRFDLGYKLEPDPFDASRWRLHFSLGESL